MCFSAPASFISAGGLGVIGGASLKRAHKREYILAVVPIIFAIQQAFEGIQWLTPDTGTVSDLASYGFLFVALLVWPIYVPLGVHHLDGKRHRIMHFFVLVGLATATYFSWLLLHEGVRVERLSYHFSYGLSTTPWIVVIGYGIATIGSLFLSSRRFLRVMGLLLLLSAVAAGLLYSVAFASVWCFFSALLSGGIYFHVNKRNRI